MGEVPGRSRRGRSGSRTRWGSRRAAPARSNTNSFETNLRFRGGLVFKAQRLLYYSTLGVRVIKKKQQYAPHLPAPTPNEVEHGAGLGASSKWGGKPDYLPYPYPFPTLSYPTCRPNTKPLGESLEPIL